MESNQEAKIGRGFCIEEVREELECLLSDKQNNKQDTVQLNQFDEVFSETVFSEQSLTVDQIRAILSDKQNDPKFSQFQQLFKTLEQLLNTLQNIHRKKPQKQEKSKQASQKQVQESKPQVQDDDSFNFDSQSREGESSQEDIDDDYVNDLKKQTKKSDE